MTTRVSAKPIELPKGVEVKLETGSIHVKGPKGSLEQTLYDAVKASVNDNVVSFAPVEGAANCYALAGTLRALVNNFVKGVTEGFEKKLELRGVGYRAQVKGNVLNLTLGFSHPVDFAIPAGITIETPSQTEVIIKGIDKQLVGETAARIRRYRPPEPYKGKGIRYSDERVKIKETKKK